MAVQWKLSGDYYVDGIGGDDANAGTSAAPFKTMGAACSAVANYETIIVGTGVYNESMNFAGKLNVDVKADGNVIFDGTGITAAMNYHNRGGNFYDCTFINGNDYGIENGVTYYYKTWYTRCTFKDCIAFAYITMYSTQYQVTHLQCKYINFSFGVMGRTTSVYWQYVNFDSCFFYNAPLLCTRNGNFNTNTYISHVKNCWFDADYVSGSAGEWPAVYMRGYSSQYTIDNCFFGPGAKILSSTTYTGGKTPAEAKALNNPIFLSSEYLQATASYNQSLSGSGAIEATAWSPTAGNNSEIFSSQLQPAFSFLAKQAPTTAYGWEGSAGNILHTDGGATWTNITSSENSLQISSSNFPTGSIVSAIVDLGSIKMINSIKSSWTTTSANACAPAVYSSSILNESPTRYTYEMSYGNASPPDSGYKVFEFDEQPYVSTNGSGSGDMGFLTSSYDVIDARYLQFRITLRTNLTGSA